MQESAVHVVITSYLPVTDKLLALFTEAMQKYPTVKTHAGPSVPGSTFGNGPYDYKHMDFVFTEHHLAIDLSMVGETMATDSMRNRIMPAVSDTPHRGQVLVSVIGPANAGKSAVIHALSRTLLNDGVDAKRVTQFSLQYPDPSVSFTDSDLAEFFARLGEKRVIFLFQKPRCQSYLDELLTHCGAQPHPSKQT